MIINNYTEELPENLETEATFLNPKSPSVFVREYNSRLNVGDTLTVRYYVTEYTMGDSWKNHLDRTFSEVFGHTFTTILSLRDADTGDESVIAKKTTYHGEHILEVKNVSQNFIGEQVLTIKTIQDDGTGSAVQYLKLLVDDPNEEPVIMDLSTLGSGNVVKSSFSYINDPSQGNTPTNPSSKVYMCTAYKYRYYKGSWGWAIHNPAVRKYKSTIVADYMVSVVYNGNDVDYIRIDVSQDPDNDGSYSDKGFIYKIDPRPWLGITRTYRSNDVITSYMNPKKDAIGGTYYIRTRVVGPDNVEYRLSDYLDKGQSEVPYVVTLAAINNKIALTRLCEAAKAYAGTSRAVLRLPQMPIIIDFRKQIDGSIGRLTGTISDFIKDTDVVTNMGMVPDVSSVPQSDLPASSSSSEYVFIGDYESPKAETRFPDRFTLDMNGSTMYVMQSDVKSGLAICISDNFDTHVINGSVVGTYKYLGAGGSRNHPENVGNTGIFGSSFCTIENMDTSYSVGYDAHFSNTSRPELISAGYLEKHAKLFNIAGYIDYDGNLVRNSDPNLSDGDMALRTNYDPDKLASYVNMDLLGSVSILVHGACLGVHKTENKTSGVFSKGINDEIFVHYYKLSDGTYTFIKTEKLHDFGVIIPPRIATHMFISSWGANVNTRSGTLQSLKSSNGSVGLYMPDFVTPCWCCGYENCTLHDNRTSMLDNETDYWCYMKNCTLWNFGAGRHVIYGGMSNQPFFVDIEDGLVIRNSGFSISDCDNAYGGRTFQVHGSHDLNIEHCTGFSLQLDKGVDGCFVNGLVGTIGEGPAFSVPIRRDVLRNNILYKFVNSGPLHSTGPLADTSPDVMLSESSVLSISGTYANYVYLNNCYKIT